MTGKALFFFAPLCLRRGQGFLGLGLFLLPLSALGIAGQQLFDPVDVLFELGLFRLGLPVARDARLGLRHGPAALRQVVFQILRLAEAELPFALYFFGPPDHRRGLVQRRVPALQQRLPLPHLFVPLLQRGQMCPRLLHLQKQGVHGLGLALAAAEGVQRLKCLVPLRPAPGQALLFLRHQAAQILDQGRMAGQKGLLLLPVKALGALEGDLHQTAQLLRPGAAAARQRVPRLEQQILVIHIDGIIKELAQDLVFLVAVGLEELFKLPLGQHDDPAELLGVEAQQLLAALRDFFRPLDGGGVRLTEQRLDGPVVILLRSPLFAEMDAPLHGIFFPVLPKAQEYPRVGGFRHVVAVEHVAAPVRAAGDAEEGEGDRVKDRGFSGPGVAGDQIQAVPEVGKAQLRFLGVGAEGRHLQVQGSHAFTSCLARKARMFSISASPGGTWGSARRASSSA